MIRRPSHLCVPLLLLCACSKPAPQAPPAQPDAKPAMEEKPAGTALVAPKPEGAATTQAPAGQKRTSLTFTAPEGWVAQTPAGGMRKAQFALPRQGKDEKDAELVVFYFGPDQGGTVEMNVQRWAGQFEAEDGGDPAAMLARTEREVRGMKVTEVAFDGIYAAETPPGSGNKVRIPGARLFGSILESDHGPYFIKVVGPAETVKHWEAAVRGYVDSAN